jgi:hypothetical protein
LLTLRLTCFASSDRCIFEMSEKEAGGGEEWCLYLPSRDKPLQPYRSARTAWPISAEELSRTESQAAASKASALNNLGNELRASAAPVVHIA